MMSFLVGLLLIGVGLLANVAAKVLADDAKTYIPRLATAIIVRAAKRLPSEHQARWCEEWLAALGELEERSRMLFHALACFLVAAPQLHAELRPRNGYVGKRALDLTIAVFAAPGLIVMVLLAALAIKATDGGPAFGELQFIGRGGRVIRVWHLRTFRLDCAGYRRPSPAGRMIERMGLTFVPLTWNVLKGDMSLVGPMPISQELWEHYPGEAYLSLRPGMTGLRHLSGDKVTSLDRLAELDMIYSKQASFLTDARLLFHAYRRAISQR